MGMSPQVQQVDPNSPTVSRLNERQSGFLDAVYQGFNPFGGEQSSPLQRQATNQLGQFLNQPAPESRALGQTNEFLQGQMNARLPMQVPTFQGAAQASTPQFSELQNPFTGMGTANPGMQVIEAAQPIFQQNLRAAMGQLANTSPSRFNTAFTQQGIDLNQQALQDFNLFAAQQLQQGQQLQNQQQQQALQFMLGSRGLQQDAVNNAGRLGLGFNQLSVDALRNQQQAQLGLMGQQQGAAALLGSLAGQAGAAPFQRALQAGQFGLQQGAAVVNPLLQLMLGGLQFGRPQGMDTVVGDSQFKQAGDFVGNIGQLIGGLIPL